MKYILHCITNLSIFILTTCTFTQCDKDEDYTYPSLLTDFMDVHTAPNGAIDRIAPDGTSTTYYLNQIITGNGLKPDTLYRAVGRYSLPDAQQHVSLYALELILAQKPAPHPANGSTVIPNDPLYLESVSRGGNYLNIVAEPLGKERPHFFSFVEESLTTNTQGNRILTISLFHNQNGDRESFPQRTYLSVALAGYPLQKGDSIYFQANIYKKGMQIWKLAY